MVDSKEPQVLGNKHDSKAGTPGSTSHMVPLALASRGQPGIGDAGENLPVGSYFGRVDTSSSWSIPLSNAYFPNVSQASSARVNGTFYVYREQNNGVDDYYVVYKEDAWASKGTLLADAGSDGASAIGFFVYRMDTQVGPTPNGAGVAISTTLPATTNGTTDKSSQTVDTFDTTVSVGFTPDGGTGNVSFQNSHQTWAGLSTSITDWSVEELTDGAQNLGKWTWFQNLPWSGQNIDVNNFSWWQSAYTKDWGGVVRCPPDLSKGTMQYHTFASWRFDRSLIAPDGTLKVTFNGSFTYYYVIIFADSFGQSGGHHQIHYYSYTGTWQKEIDLVAVAAKPKS